MKRNATIAALVLCLVLALIVIFIPKARELNLADTEISQETWDRIVSTHIKNRWLTLGDATFNGNELQLDSDGDRYFYSIAPSDENAYSPTIYIPNGNRVNVATLSPTISYESIAENRPVKMLLYTDLEYRVMELVATTLPTMNINTKWHPNITEDDSNAAIRLYDNMAAPDKRVTTSNTRIHLRGSTSIHQEKKSYKLNLTDADGANRHLSLLGMRKDDDWILNNLYADYEKVRNILATQLWRDCCTEHNEMQAPNSFEYRFVELFIDNSYAGLYLLGYKPDKKTANLNGYEYIYKNNDWANAEVLAETDNFSRYFAFDSGEVDESEAEAELREYIDAIAFGTAEEIRALFDIENAIDIELHGMITQDVDYTKDDKTKNLFWTMKNSPTRRAMMFTPWDFDLSFGNAWRDHMENMSSAESYSSPTDTVILTDQMPTGALRRLGDAEIEAEIRARYKELRDDVWSDEKIFALVDRYERRIFQSGAYYRDQARWPKGNFLEGATDLSVFREYLRERLQFVDEFYGY